MAENWLPVPGFEGRYEVSDLGRIRSWVALRPHKRPHVREGTVDPYGYISVSLSTRPGQKVIPVHRLVLAAFVGPRPDGMVTRHLDGDPTNNRLSNLTYGTPHENGKDIVRHGRHKNSLKTECKRGHAFDDANTRWSRDGRRRTCRRCESRRDAKRRVEFGGDR